MTTLPKDGDENRKQDLWTRYPEVFNRPLTSRLVVPAIFAAAFALFSFGLVDLEFSPARMLSGLHQLGWILLLMVPPDPGSSFPTYLAAMGETLSIALLGTTLAAMAALPPLLAMARLAAVCRSSCGCSPGIPMAAAAASK